MASISKDKTYVFEAMPVRQAVWKQALPAIASQMVVLIYNLADTYFVGMLDDPIQTAAVTVAFPSFLMLTAISNLFGVGGASRVAQSLGEKRADRAAQISAISFWGGVCCALLYSLLFLGIAHPILTLCGAKADTYATARGYAQWVIVFGALPTIMNTLLANLTRAEGNANRAFWGVTMGGILNIILDPLFILPQFLGLGAIGAGIAKKIDNLPLYFSIGLANGLLPLLAYNYSSGDQQRRRDALRVGCTISLSFCLITLVIFEVFAPQCTALFIDDPDTIRYGAAFLRRLMVSMPFMSLCYPLIIHFQAIGKVRQSLICSILRKGVLDIPLLFLMDRLFPLYGCMWVQTMVDVISLTAVIYFCRGLKKEGL